VPEPAYRTSLSDAFKKRRIPEIPKNAFSESIKNKKCDFLKTPEILWGSHLP
jgi:hypothetical protein